MLYPRESETREVKDLGGIWNFKVDSGDEGLREKWYEKDLSDPIKMPVPASYNDITQEITLKDHIGTVWYEQKFFAPVAWKDKKVCLRIGSASHRAVAWVNGEEVVRHKGGFLPFEADITSRLKFGGSNRLTVSVDNILDWTTLPPGEIRSSDNGLPQMNFQTNIFPEDYRVQEYFHDFFNFSGIHRPVRLIVTPRINITDITVVTDIKGKSGTVSYKVNVEGCEKNVRVSLSDREGKEVAAGIGSEGELKVVNAEFWEPGNPYLYTLKAEALDDDGNIVDIYHLPIGIRTVAVKGKEFLLNGKPFYFKGFGKHEDSDLRGKGHDDVINVKDFNLLKWIGANSFRTSHYPYSEEIMNLADQYGILVIDEAPAVGMNPWGATIKWFTEEKLGSEVLQHHLDVMEELVQRDKNHACVVAWSVANEAHTNEEGSVPYFQKVVDRTRELDPTRPVTIVNVTDPEECRVSHMFDFLGFNRYFGWYSDPGHLEVIETQLEYKLNELYNRFQKPVFMAEYGADSIAGLHHDPPVMFSEEFQWEAIERVNRVLDRLDFIVGEHIWNFADFATKQGITRVIGNRKGAFTRQRQPKMVAHFLKERWHKK